MSTAGVVGPAPRCSCGGTAGAAGSSRAGTGGAAARRRSVTSWLNTCGSVITSPPSTDPFRTRSQRVPDGAEDRILPDGCNLPHRAANHVKIDPVSRPTLSRAAGEACGHPRRAVPNARAWRCPELGESGVQTTAYAQVSRRTQAQCRPQPADGLDLGAPALIEQPAGPAQPRGEPVVLDQPAGLRPALIPVVADEQVLLVVRVERAGGGRGRSRWGSPRPGPAGPPRRPRSPRRRRRWPPRRRGPSTLTPGASSAGAQDQPWSEPHPTGAAPRSRPRRSRRRTNGPIGRASGGPGSRSSTTMTRASSRRRSSWSVSNARARCATGWLKDSARDTQAATGTRSGGPCGSSCQIAASTGPAVVASRRSWSAASCSSSRRSAAGGGAPT